MIETLEDLRKAAELVLQMRAAPSPSTVLAARDCARAVLAALDDCRFAPEAYPSSYVEKAMLRAAKGEPDA